MEVKDLSSLNPNPSNPRTISRTTFNTLKEGMKTFGDLSCIVLNRRSNQLIGGHQRIESLKAIMDNGQVVITEQLPEPNEVGTVATGYVQYGTECYKYREVDWDANKASAAGLAANHLHGDDDDQLLAEANYMLNQQAPDLLALTGQSEKEIAKLLESVGVGGEQESQPDDTNQEPAEDEKWTFQLTPMQGDIVHRVIDQVKKENGLDYKDHGTALYYLCQEWLNTHKIEQPEPSDRRAGKRFRLGMHHYHLVLLSWWRVLVTGSKPIKSQSIPSFQPHVDFNFPVSTHIDILKELAEEVGARK